MALIIYPDPNADSFVTVAQADAYISALTLDSAQWDALSIEDRERYLRIAYRNIIDNTDPTTYPDPLPSCVGESQSLMASNDMVNGLSSGANQSTTGSIKRNKVGSIEQEFYDTNKVSSVNIVPPTAQSCLSDLGYSFTNINGLTQLTLGRS